MDSGKDRQRGAGGKGSNKGNSQWRKPSIKIGGGSGSIRKFGKGQLTDLYWGRIFHSFLATRGDQGAIMVLLFSSSKTEIVVEL